MSFVPKVWKDRVSEYPTRRLLIKSDSSMEQVTVQRDEGVITDQGDAFTSANMNGLEGRIGTAIAEVATTDTYAGLHTTSKEIVNAINEIAGDLAPEFDETSGYSKGDLVRYRGSTYSANYDIVAPAGQFDPYYWTSTDVSQYYMHTINPTGTGSFSINRPPNTQVGVDSVSFGGGASGFRAFSVRGTANGADSVAFGGTAHADNSFAVNGFAGGEDSVALCGGDTAGDGAFAMGSNNEAHGKNSAVFGHQNIARGENSFVVGKAATEDTGGNFILQVGNGIVTEDPQTHVETVTRRNDAMTVDWNGNETLDGNLTIGGTPTLPNHAARLADVNKEVTEQTTINPVSVPANTATNVHNFTLDKGVYLLHVVVRCSAGAQGRRHLALFNSADGNQFYGSGYFAESEANAIGSEVVTLNLVTFVTISTDNSPVYVRVTSASSVTATPRVQYIQIG